MVSKRWQPLWISNPVIYKVLKQLVSCGCANKYNYLGSAVWPALAVPPSAHVVAIATRLIYSFLGHTSICNPSTLLVSCRATSRTERLKSYLSNRKQFVNIDGCSSELLDVICGVPQGSILGPTLFILYINDICNVSNLVKFILFADDTNAFCAGDNQLELECMLNRELAKLCKWFAWEQTIIEPVKN